MTLASALVLVVTCIYFTDARSGGAPPEACDTLTPQHSSNAAQTSDVPYGIDLCQFSDGNGGYQYTPDETYTCECFMLFLTRLGARGKL